MNRNLEDFLTYYTLSDHSHAYAVAINGEWGSGKTWFVNRFFLDEKFSAIKKINISLYGLSSTDQIDDEIFKQLHPILSNRKIAFASTIAKGVLKGTLKIDLDSNAKVDANLSVPSINLRDITKSPSEIILIFDDFERCNISPVTILGYINKFVEESHCKVIIISNEDEVHHEKENEREKYLKTREKVIGKTIRLVPDNESAYNYFCEQIKGEKFCKFLYEIKPWLMDLYITSGCRNLRLLRNFLLDFERLHEKLKEEIKENKNILWEIFYRYFIYYYEQKTSPWERVHFSEEHWHHGKKGDNSTAYYLEDKYSDIHFFDNLLKLETWVDIIFDSNICAEEINKQIEKSDRYKNKTEDWIKLWHYDRLSDQEFEQLVSSVYSQLSSSSYTQIHIINHVAGILLNLQRKELIPANPKDIIESAKTNVSYIINNNIVDLDHNKINIEHYQESWGGLGFQGRDLKEFKQLQRDIKKIIHLRAEEKHPDIANWLLEFVEKSPANFDYYLSGASPEHRWLAKTPVLYHCDAGEFIKKYMLSKDKESIISALKSRYIDNANRIKIAKEKEWIEKLKTHAIREEIINKGRLSGYLLQSFIDRVLTPSIESFS